MLHFPRQGISLFAADKESQAYCSSSELNKIPHALPLAVPSLKTDAGTRLVEHCPELPLTAGPAKTWRTNEKLGLILHFPFLHQQHYSVSQRIPTVMFCPLFTHFFMCLKSKCQHQTIILLNKEALSKPCVNVPHTFQLLLQGSPSDISRKTIQQKETQPSIPLALNDSHLQSKAALHKCSLHMWHNTYKLESIG